MASLVHAVRRVMGTVPDNLTQLNARFEASPPTEIIRWAVETLAPDVVLSSSFGADSAALIHMALQVNPKIRIVTVDTGFLFPETLQFMEVLRERWDLNLHVERTALPAAEVARLTREHATAPIDDRYCCGQYKREAMERALVGVRGWMTGLMRAEAVTRRHTPIVERLTTGLVKIAPIAPWTQAQVDAYMGEHRLPYHPLRAQGYTSIGCALHTQKPLDPADPRSGRWGGRKTECGLHDLGKSPRPRR